MIYLAAAIAALLIGLLLTRSFRTLFLEPIRLLWLLIPAAAALTAPYLIVLSRPELLWADQNRLLKLLFLTAHVIIAGMLLVNIVVQIIHLIRESGKTLSGAGIAISILLILSMTAVLAATAARGLVLWGNNGIMPVSRDYLLQIDDPIIVEGIKNNALYFKRLINESTAYAQFGQTINVPWLSRLLPRGFTYVSPAELVLAAGTFTTIILAMLLDKSRRVRSRQIAAAQEQNPSENNQEQAESNDKEQKSDVKDGDQGAEYEKADEAKKNAEDKAAEEKQKF